jgi:hypothetical protein
MLYQTKNSPVLFQVLVSSVFLKVILMDADVSLPSPSVFPPIMISKMEN